MTRSYTFRLTEEGVAELQAKFKALGADGEAAMLQLEKSAPGFGAAMEASFNRAQASRAKLQASLQKDLSDMHARLDGAVKASEANFNALEASLNPVVAAQQQFKRGQDTVTDALKRGSIMEQDAIRVKGLLQQQLVRNTQAVGGFATGLSSATRLLGALGVGLSAAAVVGWGKAVFDTTAMLVDQAQQLQVSTTALQAYRAEFTQSGSSAEEADKALAAANKTIGEAIDNIGGARRQLSEWNLDWRQLAAAAPDQRLALIAKGLLAIEDGARRARAEQTLFGKSGREVETTLQGMAAGIDAIVARNQAFITAEDVALRAKAANDELARSWQQLAVAASGPLATVVSWLAKFTYAVTESKEKSKDLSDAWGLEGEKKPAKLQPFHIDTSKDPVAAIAGRNLLGDNYAPSGFQAYLAGLKQAGDLAQLPVDKQRESLELIKAANVQLREGIVSHGKIVEFSGREVTSLDEALKVLTPTQAAEVRRLAALTSSGVAAEKLRKTMVDVKDIDEDAARAAQAREGFLRSVLIPLRDEVGLASQTRDVREQELDILRLKQQYGAAVVAMSENELRALLKQRDVMTGDDIIADMKERVKLAGMAADEAERESAVLQAIHATHGNLTDDQANQIRLLTEAQQQSERILDTAGQVKDVITNWAETGKISLSDLSNVFKRQLIEMAAQALLSPIIIPMVQQVSSSYGSGAMGGLTNMLGGQGGGIGSLVQGIGGSGTGGLGGLLSGGIDGIGTMLGFGTSATAGSMSIAMPSMAGAFGSTIGGGTAAISTGLPAIPGSIFGSSLTGVLGGVGIGSMAGQLLFGNKNDAGMGSMGGATAGAMLGSIFPGVGTIIGGLLGGVLGGGLGSMTGSNNKGAISNFNADGSNYLFNGSGANATSSQQAAASVSAVISALKAQGVDVSMGNVTGLNIGTDKSYVYTADGGKQKLGGGDVKGVVAAVLNQILPGASGGSSEAQAVLDHYRGAGGINSDNISQVASDLGFAKSLQDLDLGEKQLTQSEQALKAINDQYQQLIDKAAELGLSTDRIVTARQSAIQTLIDGFNDGISGAISQIEDPMKAAADALSAAQAQRIKEATALGADLTEVYRLNALETKNLTDLQAAQAAAQSKQVSDFNEQIRIGTLGFTDALGAALATEDDAGRARVEQAQAIGADLVSVEKYNGLMRQKVLDEFAAQAKQEADRLQSESQARQATIDGAKGGLAGLVANLTSGADAGLSPDQRYFALLTGYNQAKAGVLASPDDPTAIGGFSSAASALFPVAHEFLGTSQRLDQLRNDILGIATKVGGDFADPSGYGRAMVEATAQGSGAIVDVIAQTNSRLDLLQQTQERLAAQMGAVIMRQSA